MNDEEKTEKLFDQDILEFLGKLQVLKQNMMKQNLKIAKTTCPRCQQKTCILTIKGTKNHIWADCRNCTFKLME